jgi:hypothetical protein
MSEALEFVDALFKLKDVSKYWWVCLIVISVFLFLRGNVINYLTADILERKLFPKKSNIFSQCFVYFWKSVFWTIIIMGVTVTTMNWAIVKLIISSMNKFNVFQFFSIIIISLFFFWEFCQEERQDETNSASLSEMSKVFDKYMLISKKPRPLINITVVLLQISLMVFFAATFVNLCLYIFLDNKNNLLTLIIVLGTSFFASLFFPYVTNIIFKITKLKEERLVTVRLNYKKWYVSNIINDEYFILSNKESLKRSDITRLIKKEDLLNKDLHIKYEK